MASNKFGALALPVDKPTRMIIVHPVTRQPLRDAKGEEAYIELHSADSDIAQKHWRAVQRRRLAIRGRNKLTPEEIETEAVELLAALTVGWRLLTLDAAPLDVPFNQANARELYSDPGLAWLREQVDECAGDRGNFSRASSPS